MASVGFRFDDRVYGLDQPQAQFLGGQLRRRLTIPPEIDVLADQIWQQSMRNPEAYETSADIDLTPEQKRELLDVMTRMKPEGDLDAWTVLTEALRRDLEQTA